MRRLLVVLPVFLLVFSSSLNAANLVAGLQMPAWVERAGVRQALRLGTELQAGDVLTTGQQARLVLRLDEGSVVKLGAEAQFEISDVAVAQDQWGEFSGIFKVLKGAFRFTTAQLSKLRKRNVEIRVGAATAGIRGTDLWGRSNQEADVVCLIEGQISVSGGGKSAEMNQALTFYRIPKWGTAESVSPVAEQQLALWADETEMQAGAGILATDGPWVLHIAAFDELSAATDLIARLGDAGFFAEQETAEVAAKTWYRVVINGFATVKDAKAAAEVINLSVKLHSTWVSKRS